MPPGRNGDPPVVPKSSPPRATPAAGWAQEPAPWLTGCPRGQRCPLPFHFSFLTPGFWTGFWKATCPSTCSSPLLAFVNSKSGDNQGVKFLRKFKQFLNPAQVFDLMNGGPHLG